jgi:hypothetical protein
MQRPPKSHPSVVEYTWRVRCCLVLHQCCSFVFRIHSGFIVAVFRCRCRS